MEQKEWKRERIDEWNAVASPITIYHKSMTKVHEE
jgi:hypothetical protein